VGRTLLIIDDSPTLRDRLGETLRGAGMFTEVLKAGNGIEGFKLLLSQPVDLILCDLVMPGIDGFKFLGLKHSKPEYNEVPVIMLTGEEDVRAKVRGLEAGASDYLTKPFHDEELVARVKAHLKIKALQDELRDKNARLEQLSRTDELSGLNNRRHFMELLRTEWSRAQRYNVDTVFAMVDIDHFKKVNDSLGHLAGDCAIVEVAKALQNAVRSQDMLGRYGGEEFAIIMPHTDRAGGVQAAERICQQIAGHKFLFDGKPLSVTVSVGVTTYPNPKVERLEDLIGRADAALYKAKGAGRNRVVVDSPEE
jgi:two-component system cell cycle response regulator